MSLITAYEVLKYSPAGKTYPTAQFCELIPQIEQEVARNCLGVELYNYLVSKLTTYPTGATEWVSGTTYANNATVIRNGCLFVSNINGNLSDPLADNGTWDAFERFTDANCNTFWTAYLRRLLALKVYNSSLVFTTYQANAGGLVVSAGDAQGFRAANKQEMTTLKADVIALIETVTANMLFWLKDNRTAAGFPDTGLCEGGNCDLRSTRRRRWAMN